MDAALRVADVLVVAGWLLFLVVWVVGSRSVRPDKQRQASASRAFQVALMLVASMLSFAAQRLPLGPLNTRLFPRSVAVTLVAVFVAEAGIAFAIWARVVLGRNWSDRVSLKHGHQLVEVGPYAFVRHPIYTGLLTAFVGMALLQGTLAALVAVSLFTLVFVSKLRLEERFLASEFGSAYDDYRARVKALIPFVV